MAICWDTKSPNPWGEHVGKTPCFFCGKPLTLPIIGWSGAGGELLLHPPCLMELQIRLMRDVHEYTRKADVEATFFRRPEPDQKAQ